MTNTLEAITSQRGEFPPHKKYFSDFCRAGAKKIREIKSAFILTKGNQGGSYSCLRQLDWVCWGWKVMEDWRLPVSPGSGSLELVDPIVHGQALLDEKTTAVQCATDMMDTEKMKGISINRPVSCPIREC